MDLLQAIEERHSIRSYTDKNIEGETLKKLQTELQRLNDESGLNMQLVINEPKAFGGRMAHYGKFSGVKNYVAVVGKKTADFQEKCGYYGEKFVLYAQTLGLNTCWVALTYSKTTGAFEVKRGEKLLLVIAVGYGAAGGRTQKSKTVEQVTDGDLKNAPEWFFNGVKAALKAPTAINQQKFVFSYNDGKVKARAKSAFYAKTDLGIAICHFEIGSGVKIFKQE